MASDDDHGYSPREPLTPLYDPSSGSAQTPGQRAPRHGPLGARLSQRGRTTQPPAHGMEAPYSPYTLSAPETGGEAPEPGGGDYVPSGPVSSTWDHVTSQLKLDEKVTGALHADLRFGATWNSRSEMLRACLDEYYRLVASYNEARRLLELCDGDIEELRREQIAASMRLREVESRLEFHSRAELRAVYLGAAETETRLFRAEEERDLLSSRAELLEGFMAFLSRIIATVRAIPSNVVMGENGAPAAGANGVRPGLPAGAQPDETLLYNGASDHRPAESAAQTPAGSAGAPSHEIEELVLDENEVALLASSEYEIIEILDDESASAGEGVTPQAASAETANDTPTGATPAEAASDTSGEIAGDVMPAQGPDDGEES